MKKILLTIAVAVATVAGAQAQTSYGIKAGVNLGELTHAPGQSVNTSFFVTGFGDFALSPNFSIQPGLSLQGKGTKFKAEYENIANAEATLNVMSIEIPVNAVYYIPTGESGKVFLGAGPYIGFNVSAKQKIKGSTGNFSVDESTNLKFSGDDRSMNVIDAGLNFMLGYKLTNGFLINAGYNLGLTNNLYKSDKIHANRVWSFGVGFQF